MMNKYTHMYMYIHTVRNNKHYMNGTEKRKLIASDTSINEACNSIVCTFLMCTIEQTYRPTDRINESPYCGSATLLCTYFSIFIPLMVSNGICMFFIIPTCSIWNV